MRNSATESVIALIASMAIGSGANAQASAGTQATPTGAAPIKAEGDAQSGPIADVVVTAEKRRTSLQRTPIAISAISGEMLEKTQVRDFDSIRGLVPSFNFGQVEGQAQLSIRGIGPLAFLPTAEGQVAVNLNEIYVSRLGSLLGSFFDIDGIEVLRGPQGTLYGRNATAGSVNIRTALPTEELSGRFRAQFGNYQTVNLEAAISGPLIRDRLMVRLAAATQDRAGYGRNLVTGHEIDDLRSRAIRLTVLAKPSEDVTATLFVEHYRQNDNNGGVHYIGNAGEDRYPGSPTGNVPQFRQLGGFNSANIRDLAAGIDPYFKLKYTALTGVVEWQTERWGLKSVTGYRTQDAFVLTNLGGGFPTPGYFYQGEPAHQFSQELQVNLNTDRLKLTAGGYYFQETDSSLPGNGSYLAAAVSNAFALPVADPKAYILLFQFGGTVRTKAPAIFAEGTYKLTDKLSVTAGIRYSHETKDFSQRYSRSFTQLFTGTNPEAPAIRRDPITFNSTTPKLGLQYQVSTRTMIYATYVKGFKPGGFALSDQGPPYRPENLTDYEGGIKTTLFDGRLRANVGAFYYDYTDLQVQTVAANPSSPTGASPGIFNAGSAKLYGLESDFTLQPSSALRIDLSFAYNHSKFGQYFTTDQSRPLLPPLGGAAGTNTVNYAGNQLPNAPTLRLRGAVDYTWHLPTGSLDLLVSSDYSSRVYLQPSNLRSISQRPYAKVDAFLTYEHPGGWKASVFVRNLTDITTLISAVPGNRIDGYTLNGAIAPPRTYGAEIGYRF